MEVVRGCCYIGGGYEREDLALEHYVRALQAGWLGHESRCFLSQVLLILVKQRVQVYILWAFVAVKKAIGDSLANEI